MTDIDKIRRKQNATCGVCDRKWNDHRMRHKFLGDKPDVADIPVLLDYIDALAASLAVEELETKVTQLESSMTEQAVILSESAARYRDRAIEAERKLELALRTIRLLAKTAEGDRESRQLLAVWWEQAQADVDIVIAALLRRDVPG